MKMTRNIICYIQEHALSPEDIADKTGVDKSLLSGNVYRSLSASELLEICNYLQIDPYILWKTDRNGEK